MKPPVGKLIPAWMKLGSEEVEGWVVDISVDGVRVASKSLDVRHLTEHQPVRVRLALPGSNDAVEVVGEIVTVIWCGTVTYFGIHFGAARSSGSGDVDMRIVDYVVQRQREMLQLLWERGA